MRKILDQKYFALLAPFIVLMFFSFFESALLFQFSLPYPLVSLLICFVFYFSIFNPVKLNLIFVFLLGLASDFFMSYPLGFQSFALLVGAFLAGFNRRILFQVSFHKQWAIFVMTLFCVYVLNLLLLKVFLDLTISFSNFLTEFIFISLMYPFLAKLAAFINQKTEGCK